MVQELIPLFTQALIVSHAIHSMEQVVAHNLCTTDALDALPWKGPNETPVCLYFVIEL